MENNGSGRERMIRARRLATCNSYAGERFRNPCEAGETRPLGPIFARWFEAGMQNASPPPPPMSIRIDESRLTVRDQDRDHSCKLKCFLLENMVDFEIFFVLFRSCPENLNFGKSDVKK